MNSRQHPCPRLPASRSRGVSLIELMVAMVIGLILIAGALAVFVETRATAKVNQTLARMQENGQFALDELARSVTLAGYVGQNNEITLLRNAGDLPASATACTDLTRPLDGGDASGFGGTATMANTAPYDACVVNDTYLPGTDIVAVRHVDPSPPLALEADTVYVRADPAAACLFVGVTPPACGGAAAEGYRLRSDVYYVSPFLEDPADGIPTLKQMTLRGDADPEDVDPLTGAAVTGIAMVERPVIPGVENLQVQYGLDTNGDGSANQYVNAVPAGAWSDVVAVRLWLIVRALPSCEHLFDPDDATAMARYDQCMGRGEAGFVNTATYVLPQEDLVLTAAMQDPVRRMRLTRTVQLRNQELEQ